MIPRMKHPLRALHIATVPISAPDLNALLCLTLSSHLWQDRMRAVVTARRSSWRLGTPTCCELLHDVRHVGCLGREGVPISVARCRSVCRAVPVRCSGQLCTAMCCTLRCFNDGPDDVYALWGWYGSEITSKLRSKERVGVPDASESQIN